MRYAIGDFSKISRLSIKALRLYHEQGILAPSAVDRESGYRYYDEKSLERASVVHMLKELDFSLKEIKEILDCFCDDSQIVGQLRQKAEEIGQKIFRYRKIQTMLQGMIRQQEEYETMHHSADIVIKEIPDLLICGLRFRGRYNEVGKYLGQLGRQCGRHFRGPVFSLYYDTEFKDEDADIEACIGVRREFSGKNVQSRRLAGGRAVTLLHHGPYETIGLSYKKVIDFINAGSLRIQSPVREVYLKGPGVIFRGNEKKYVTEIQWLLGDSEKPHGQVQ